VRPALDLITSDAAARDINTAELIAELQATMQSDVGTLRTADTLMRAQTKIAQLEAALGEHPPGDGKAFDLRRLEWFDLRNMLLVARTVTQAALARTESRGAHQREDFPDTDPQWEVNQVARLQDREIALARAAVSAYEVAAQ
jgi:succinate dehydrogenase/fumarate reductase flavoprotein subunit